MNSFDAKKFSHGPVSFGDNHSHLFSKNFDSSKDDVEEYHIPLEDDEDKYLSMECFESTSTVGSTIDIIRWLIGGTFLKNEKISIK
jgi:hypothetical protein